jgi:hypothetical protein
MVLINCTVDQHYIYAMNKSIIVCVSICFTVQKELLNVYKILQYDQLRWLTVPRCPAERTGNVRKPLYAYNTKTQHTVIPAD